MPKDDQNKNSKKGKRLTEDTFAETPQEQILKTEYSELMQKSYIDYAMSVIVARALPDVRDGLKPVQRRTLYDMHELGIRSDRPFRKSARIVGDTMGKYHPHGDSSIYDALVVMAQDFKKEIPLIDGHGNFGNIEGDGAAAMRYTEARLEKITEEAFLADLDKDVVDFVPNFDENEKEPEVLPVKIPNFLINGSEGIAVGMATSTPPHNLAEIVKPFVREIWLFDSHVAGTTHLDDQSVLETIAVGDVLILRREDNRHDSNAILVLNRKKQKLGYVPKKDNAVFARLMDAGKLLQAKVAEIEHRKNYTLIKIGVYLIDL